MAAVIMNKQRDLDFYTTPSMRDAGIKRAADHAEQSHTGWTEQAVEYVRAFAILHHGQQFTGEDVRLFAESKVFPIPPHKRAWGNVMLTAAKRGIIRKVGYQKTTCAQSHEAIATLWESI